MEAPNQGCSRRREVVVKNLGKVTEGYAYYAQLLHEILDRSLESPAKARAAPNQFAVSCSFVRGLSSGVICQVGNSYVLSNGTMSCRKVLKM